MTLIQEGAEGSQETQSGQEENKSSDGRPEYVELQFWDADTSQVRVKEMAQALSDTQTKMRNQKDEMRAEIESELKKGRPENPEAYEVKELDLPPESKFEIPEGNKLIEDFRKWAYDVGLTQDQFKEAVSLYAQDLEASLPNTEKEIEALGENAQERIAKLSKDVKQSLDERGFEVFQDMVDTAEKFEVLERLVSRKPSGPSSFDQVEPGAHDLGTELSKIMNSKEYLANDPYANQQALEMAQRLAKSRGRA